MLPALPYTFFTLYLVLRLSNTSSSPIECLSKSMPFALLLGFILNIIGFIAKSKSSAIDADFEVLINPFSLNVLPTTPAIAF